MPVDFIKAKISPSEHTRAFFERVNVNWGSLEKKEVLDADTGELKKRTIGIYKNLRFSLYESGTLMIDGSLHRYSNSGLHNYDLFSYSRLVKVLNELKEVFKINLNDIVLQNLEIGLNINTQFKSSKIVESILLHRQAQSKYVSIENSEYKQCIHSRYLIKSYDKKLHYNNKPFINVNGVTEVHKIQSEIFRFEMKHIKMIALNAIGISTLNDLLDINKLRVATELLCEQWDKLLIYDWTIRKTELTKHNKNVKLYQWSNPRYWLNLSKSHRNNEKKKMRELMQFHSQNIQNIVSNKLRETAQNILKETAVKKYTKTDSNCVPINTSYILLESTQKQNHIITKHFNIENLVLRRSRIPRKAS